MASKFLFAFKYP